MRSEAIPPGTRLADSWPFSSSGTAQQAQCLKRTGIDGFIGYLGVMTRERLAFVLAAGLGFMPVTLAEHYSGASAVSQCRSLGIPEGTTVWLDVEGQNAWNTPAETLMKTINDWAEPVINAGYIPGGYFGAPQPLSSDQMWRLKLRRYWKGGGRCVDRSGALAEPRGCGWCAYQVQHLTNAGQWWPNASEPNRVLVDVDITQRDYLGRSPTWAVQK